MFIKVSRIKAKDESNKTTLELDINCELYPMEEN